MTDAEYKKEILGACSMKAQDIKGNADYAAHNFKQGDEWGAKKYVRYIEENLARLKISVDGGGK